MVIHTYLDKVNTMVRNLDVNVGLNPISALYYGGSVSEEQFTRMLFYFDATRLVSLYTGNTFTDLTKLTHIIRFTNTGSLDTSVLNGTYSSMQRTSSFDLITFQVNQYWDSGVGYDYSICNQADGDCGYSNTPSNWLQSQTGIYWSGGSGSYSGSSSGVTIATQHFDKGNENIEMDITPYVNAILTGDTNYGFGIAYPSGYEAMATTTLQYVGFFTNNTQTFFEPYLETTYSNHIQDDRNNFYLDKPNQLYLYVNLAGNPTNLDTNPTVTIYDPSGNVFSAYTSSAVTNVTLGVYSIPIMIPTTSGNSCTMYTDVWSGLTISGVSRNSVELNIPVKDSIGYYNIGDNDMLPKKVVVTIGGIQNQEKIKSGDIRKVIVSARIPYSVNQTQNISGLEYRLYVLEGTSELTVIDFQPVEMANNHYYFLLDTLSLISNTYYIDIKATSNLEVTTQKNVVKFDIVNQVELRSGT